MNFVVTISLVANVLLFVIKVMAAYFSHSLAVGAAAVDSGVDILAQAILYYANRDIQNKDPTNYPAGKDKMETVAVILCASLMGMAAMEIIFQSLSSLYAGWVEKDITPVFFDDITVVVLCVVIILKTALWAICNALRDVSVAVMALAEDHRNDVMSNGVAIVTAFIAHSWGSYWWVDPLGAIIISVFIVVNWSAVAKEQISHLVGQSAPPEFYRTVIDLANSMDERMYADIVRAYHFGSNYLVELEVVMPAAMSVKESHGTFHFFLVGISRKIVLLLSCVLFLTAFVCSMISEQ